MKKNGVRPNENVYAELGSTWWTIMRDPDQAAHLLGKLFRYVGQDNVLWGTDCIFYGSPQDQIQTFRSFQISNEFQERFGYPELTHRLKAKVLGLNGARVYGIDPSRRKCEFTRRDLEQIRRQIGAEPHLRAAERRGGSAGARTPPRLAGMRRAPGLIDQRAQHQPRTSGSGPAAPGSNWREMCETACTFPSLGRRKSHWSASGQPMKPAPVRRPCRLLEATRAREQPLGQVVLGVGSSEEDNAFVRLSSRGFPLRRHDGCAARSSRHGPSTDSAS